MKASQAVLAVGGLAVVGAVLALWLPYHRLETEAERYRVTVHQRLLESARSYAAELPRAFDTGPQNEESLQLLGRGQITYLTATAQAPTVTVYFEAAAPVGGPMAFAPDQEKVCFREDLREGPDGVVGDPREIPCTEMPQVVLGRDVVLTVGGS